MAGEKTSQNETELKLAVDPKWLSKLASFEMPGWTVIKRKQKKLANTYYDTDSLQFLEAGCSLRVREAGGTFTQTLKSDSGSDALHRRIEENVELPDNHITVPRISDPALAEEIGFLFNGDLVPVFQNRFERLAVELENGRTGSVVEVAFDKGVVRHGRKQQSFAELELELVTGEPSDLYGLAMSFADVAPIYFSGDTKSSLGYRIGRGIQPDYKVAGIPELARGMSVAEAMQSVFRNCFGQWIANQAAVLSDHHPEGVHQMRVSLRRMRSALSLFGKFLTDDVRIAANRDFRWAAETLGPARDLDVFLAEIIAPIAGRTMPEGVLQPLTDAAEQARRRRTPVMRRALMSKRYTAAVLRTGLWIETLADGGLPQAAHDTPVEEIAGKLLARRHAKVLSTGKGFEKLGYDERHMVRIALKKLRYANEFFRSLYDERSVKRYGRLLSALQDDLGFMNDMAMSMTLAGELGGDDQESGDYARAHGFLLGWQQRQLLASNARMCADWRAFRQARPYWKE